MAGRPVPAVKALIEREGKFLAVEMEAGEKGTLWTLPGGRVEQGESPEEALRREVMEEVSLEVDVHRPLGMFHFFFGEENENQVVLTVFRCTPAGGEVDIDSNPAEENITGYDWLERGEFMDLEAEDTLKELVSEHYDRELPKLVRDRIPEIIREDGGEPVTEQVSKDEVRRYLADKLVEEAKEFREERDQEELADVLEVLKQCCEVASVDFDEIDSMREEKKLERGGFEDNIVLRDIED